MSDARLDAGETGCGELVLLAFFIENGGKLWVCPPCFNARGLDKDKLVPAASFAGGAPVVELLAQDAASLNY